MAGRPGILLTRPAGRGIRLRQSLEARGFPVFHVPCLALEPVLFTHQPQEIAELDTFSSVIAISPTAAELAVAQVDRYWPQWPVQQTWLATGRQTAEVLESLPQGPLVRTPGPNEESAEGLLGLPELAQVDGQRILILKGHGGREVLGEELTRRGALVSELNLYQRSLPASGGEELQKLLQERCVGMSVVLSGATLDNLLQLSGGLASRLQKVPICVPGDRLVDYARRAGFNSVIAATGAATGALLQAIDAWWRQRNEK